ncbi:MAG: hypothetical protein JWR23_495 [Mucilaginibacter sp.]|nr:hypothetical protein [Mucilaginibacter sp.]
MGLIWSLKWPSSIASRKVSRVSKADYLYADKIFSNYLNIGQNQVLFY